jgi:hypothetical protein
LVALVGNHLTPVVVLTCCFAAVPAGAALADRDPWIGEDPRAGHAAISAAPPIRFKPGTYKGRTTQGLPISFKASKTGVSRFRVEIELYCYRAAAPGSLEPYVLEGSSRERFTLRDGKYGFGATTKKRSFFRFNEQPDANTRFSSDAIFLKGKRSNGDLFVSRADGETECSAARRDTATGEFTELTPSFDIRRRK